MVQKHVAVFASAMALAVAGLVAAQTPQPAAPAPAAKTAPAAPPDAKTLLANAAKAMGSANLKSVQYSGAGSIAGIGQNKSPDADWPLARMKSYTREIDLAGPSSHVKLVRVQGANDQTQEETIVPASPWSAQYQLWLDPYVFLAGAQANPTTVEAKTVLGEQLNVATFMVQSKYKVNGYFDSKNQIRKIETWVDNPVLGDMLVETYFDDYQDFGGLKVPTTMITKQGGHNTLILVVSDAKPNAAVSIQAAQQAQTPPPPVTVQSQKIADGVLYLTGGTHHSVAVEFADYIAVIEAPQNEERSLAVIKEIRKELGKKPIRYVINTHHHFDHAGGLRTYVDEGATIITPELDQKFLEQALSAPRTINPDKLALSKKPPMLTIEPVTDKEKKVLSDKTRTLELYLIKDSPHADGILMAYLPKAKILVEADVYTPPAANAPAAATVNPATKNLVDNVDRLKLDVERVLPLHGPGMVTKADMYKAAGKTPPAANESANTAPTK
jgi:glyoxylase-like metal-dependent hydrolase (beta-lactamase superfamily II)